MDFGLKNQFFKQSTFKIYMDFGLKNLILQHDFG